MYVNDGDFHDIVIVSVFHQAILDQFSRPREHTYQFDKLFFVLHRNLHMFAKFVKLGLYVVVRLQ